jgi:hypothetical protein
MIMFLVPGTVMDYSGRSCAGCGWMHRRAGAADISALVPK